MCLKKTGQQPFWLGGASTSMAACVNDGLAGAAAGLIGNPTEVVLVRMCAHGVDDVSQTYCYRKAFSGLIKISQEEGMQAFDKGLLPNVVRSVVMNVAQISIYTAAGKQFLTTKVLDLKDGVPVHNGASLLAGLAATTACAPADVLKSKIQSADGKGEGLMRILRTNSKAEGPSFLMKGWTPALLRLGSNTVLMFLFYEQLPLVVERCHLIEVVAATSS